MAGATYSWNFDAGASPPTATTKGPINVTWSTGGTKTIKLQVSLNGCSSAQATQTVTIYPNPVASIGIGANSLGNVCKGANTTVSYSGPSLGPTAVYNWTWGGGTVSSGSGPGPYMVSWGSTGSKSVTLQIIENGCPSNIVTKVLTVHDTPDVIAYVTPTNTNNQVCGNAPLELDASHKTTSGPYNYVWYGPNGFQSQPSSNSKITIPNPQSGNYTLIITDSRGCQGVSSTPANITVNTPPTVSLGYNPACQGAPLTFNSFPTPAFIR
jgi:hypothetical protein